MMGKETGTAVGDGRRSAAGSDVGRQPKVNAVSELAARMVAPGHSVVTARRHQRTWRVGGGGKRHHLRGNASTSSVAMLAKP